MVIRYPGVMLEVPWQMGVATYKLSSSKVLLDVLLGQLDNGSTTVAFLGSSFHAGKACSPTTTVALLIWVMYATVIHGFGQGMDGPTYTRPNFGPPSWQKILAKF